MSHILSVVRRLKIKSKDMQGCNGEGLTKISFSIDLHLSLHALFIDSLRIFFSLKNFIGLLNQIFEIIKLSPILLHSWALSVSKEGRGGFEEGEGGRLKLERARGWGYYFPSHTVFSKKSNVCSTWWNCLSAFQSLLSTFYSRLLTEYFAPYLINISD